MYVVIWTSLQHCAILCHPLAMTHDFTRSLAPFHKIGEAKGGLIALIGVAFVFAGVQDHSNPRHPRATLHALWSRPGGDEWRRPLTAGPVLGAGRGRMRRRCRHERGSRCCRRRRRRPQCGGAADFGFLWPGNGVAVLVLLFILDGGCGGWTREAFQDSVR